MTDAPELEVTLLDVGHGNAAILRSDVTIVVDAPPGPSLPQELERTQSLQIDHLVLSHADRDHIGGAVAILSHPQLKVDKLWFNPDAEKDTSTWGDLLYLARVLHVEGRLGVRTSLNAASDPIANTPSLRVDVLHPDVELAGRGPRAESKSAGAISANSMSAVLRVSQDGEPVLLLSGDMDFLALERLEAIKVDLAAQVLVFPHHGGHSGGDDRSFAARLCRAVGPRWIIFSFARNRFRNPLEDIVSGISDAAPDARIMCTQLSRRCAIEPLRQVSTQHWTDRSGDGTAAATSCAGTVVIGVTSGTVTMQPARADHLGFIRAAAPSAVCIGAGLTGPEE